MNKIISLAIVLLFVALAVSADPRVQSTCSTYVAHFSSHIQYLGGNSGGNSVWGLQIAALHSKGVCGGSLTVDDPKGTVTAK